MTRGSSLLVKRLELGRLTVHLFALSTEKYKKATKGNGKA
jgi:hypothetical protein